jgi:hypothetical protein
MIFEGKNPCVVLHSVSTDSQISLRKLTMYL